MNEIIESLRGQLKENIDEHAQLSTKRFFKEEIKSYGIKMAKVNQIAKDHLKGLKKYGKDAIFDLCETLWQSGYLEESMVACNWAYSLRKKYEPTDFERFKNWVDKYVNNWASCDTLCNHTVGDFVMMYPDYLLELKRFTESENRWMKRAAAVTLIIPARKGLFLNTIFEISDSLLLDKDDLVQKGYGWMLKAASQAHQQDVFNYIMQNKATMPRTALRYAIEKMPKGMKAEAMEK